MINKNDVAVELDRLANHLKDFDSLASRRLFLLSAAISAGKNAEDWSSSDLFKLINPDIIVENYKNKISSTDRFIAYFRILFYILIFLPLIFTGYAAAQAIRQYSSSSSVTQSVSIGGVNTTFYKPFILFWQQGPGLPSAFVLGNVVLIDVVAIIFLLIVFLIIYFLRGSANSSRVHKALQLKTQLADTLAGAELIFRNTSNLIRPVTAEGNLDNVARQIESLAFEVAKNFDAMTRQVLRGFSQSTEAAMQQLSASQQAFYEMIKTQEDNVKTLASFSSQVIPLFGNLQTIITVLENNIAKMDQSIRGLLPMVSDLLRQGSQSVQVSQDIANIMKISINTQNEIITQQRQLGRDFINSLDTLEVSLLKNEELIKNTEMFMGNLNTLLQQFEQERIAQNNLSDRMLEATVGVREALQSMHEAGIAMRSMAVDMNDMLRLQATFTGDALKDALNSLAGLPNAMKIAMEQSFDNLHTIPEAVSNVIESSLSKLTLVPEATNNLVQSSLETVVSLPAATREIIQSFEHAALAINRSCKSLESSAFSIHNASEALTLAISHLKEPI